MKHWLAAVLLCLAAFSPQAALGREEIRSFIADIVVNVDSSLEVTETITVNAEGNAIRRGIYRDIPLRALNELGLWVSNGFDLVEVLHNGARSPHSTEWHGRFLRILIGDADVFIPRGEHTYTIRYVTTRQLRYFDGYDELYWNVTGNFWSFPILSAEARVMLPQGATASQVFAYTGPFGAEGRDYTVSGEGSPDILFETTRTLGPEEGMTIAVGFTKGVVMPDEGGAFAVLGANAGLLLMIVGWLAVPVYFLYVWNRVGRDPPSPPIIPLFHPPEKLSPAALSFAHFNGFRAGKKGIDLPFIAALLSLGVKRFLVIDEDAHGTVTLQRGAMADAQNRPALPSGEAALYAGLLENRQEMILDKHNGPALQSAGANLRAAISKEYAGRYYTSNLGWLILGAIVAAASFIVGLVLQNPPDEGLLYLIPVLMTSLFGGGMWVAGRSLFREGGLGSRFIGAVLFVLGAGVFLIGVLVVVVPGDLPVYQFAGALLILGMATMIAMIWLIGAPTAIGAKVLTDIKGFKLYLETAETNRLNMRDAPQMSEELFERFLPYAAGLGVEKPWSEAWAAQLARIAPERTQAYQPKWY
ncbi:MAG: DUF2207 domain-containing protein, partial [Hoeflea sp.]|nr:DUF2207 domain-containing protein [Hoeflea sp.]